ncbi:hypothetical protein Tco_0060562 [Tanacetum coccineum]
MGRGWVLGKFVWWEELGVGVIEGGRWVVLLLGVGVGVDVGCGGVGWVKSGLGCQGCVLVRGVGWSGGWCALWFLVVGGFVGVGGLDGGYGGRLFLYGMDWLLFLVEKLSLDLDGVLAVDRWAGFGGRDGARCGIVVGGRERVGRGVERCDGCGELVGKVMGYEFGGWSWWLFWRGGGGSVGGLVGGKVKKGGLGVEGDGGGVGVGWWERGQGMGYGVCGEGVVALRSYPVRCEVVGGGVCEGWWRYSGCWRWCFWVEMGCCVDGLSVVLGGEGGVGEGGWCSLCLWLEWALLLGWWGRGEVYGLWCEWVYMGRNGGVGVVVDAVLGLRGLKYCWDSEWSVGVVVGVGRCGFAEERFEGWVVALVEGHVMRGSGSWVGWVGLKGGCVVSCQLVPMWTLGWSGVVGVVGGVTMDKSEGSGYPGYDRLFLL